MEVTIISEQWGYQTPEEIEDEGVAWCMTFVIKAAEGALDYTYVVHEPDYMTVDEWKCICEGVAGYYRFYQGNGEGSIDITKDGVMVFNSHLSGAGGDVSGTMRIPHTLVKSALQNTIDQARERGWFRE